MAADKKREETKKKKDLIETIVFVLVVRKDTKKRVLVGLAFYSPFTCQ